MHAHIQQRIQSIIENLNQLPSIPDVASKVLHMVSDPDVVFKAIAEEISKDQAITTNILKLCNSAYFSKGKEISSVDRAIVTLGIKEVKDIVIVATTREVLNKIVIGYDLARGELWKHGIAVATMSKKIATMKNRKNIADIAFTGGIIHDVGKTVLAIFVQNTFKEILALSESKQIPFSAAEKEIMGFDHQEIGEKILAKWKFPDVLRNIVRYHHEPQNAPDEYKPIVSIVHIANTICLMAGIGIGSDGLYHEVSDLAVKTLSFTNKELEQLYADTPQVMNEIKDIL
jgi:putative nucleotidyltransferase with HDIG domain